MKETSVTPDVQSRSHPRVSSLPRDQFRPPLSANERMRAKEIKKDYTGEKEKGRKSAASEFALRSVHTASSLRTVLFRVATFSPRAITPLLCGFPLLERRLLRAEFT